MNTMTSSGYAARLVRAPSDGELAEREANHSAHAQAILASAREEAERVLEHAREEAARIREEARVEVRGVRETATKTIDVKRLLASRVMDLREPVAELVRDACAKIIGRADDPVVYMRIIARGLREIACHGAAQLVVAPVDEANARDVVARCRDGEVVTQVVVDHSIEPGSCRLEAGDIVIVLGLREQLELLAEALGGRPRKLLFLRRSA